MTERPVKEPSILDEPSAFSKPAPRTFNRNDLPAQDLEQLRAENARLAEALVDAMIVPEAWLISGRPIGISDEAWAQIQRSVHFARAALSADPAPVAGVAVPVGAVEALANYQQGDMDGTFVLVSRQAIEECLPALRAIAGENGND